MSAQPASMPWRDLVGWLGAELGIDGRRLRALDPNLVGVIAQHINALRERADALRDDVTIDELTGALKRAAGERALAVEVGRAFRAAEPVALALLALDEPEPAGEIDGQATGDELMVQLVSSLREHLRAYDLVVRWGERELLCVLPRSDMIGADRILKDIAVAFARSTLRCFSGGIAELAPGDTPLALVQRAEGTAAAERTRSQDRLRRPRPASRQRPPATVLLVEDDAEIREMYALRLRQAGYQTLAVGDGEKALKSAAKLEPDLILLDMHLPFMDGETVLMRLRADARLRRVPVVVISNLADDPALGQRLRALGAIDCVLKSGLTPGALVEAIPGWLTSVYGWAAG
jgi:diguanylate cyclase (GGDEF)-like protein